MNGFTPAGVGSPPSAEDPCDFVFAGTVTAGERPDIVLSAFEQVEARYPGRLRLRIFGPTDPWKSRGPASRPWLYYGGLVTPGEAREAMAASSVTVLCQQHPALRQILSGKAFEYIGARRPILAIVQPDSEMAEILRANADARIVPIYDVQLIAAEVERLVIEHTAGRLARPTVSQEQIEPLSRAGQARILDRILRELMDAA